MTDPAHPPHDAPKPISETLAELVAQRKAALAQTAKSGPRGGARVSEQVAAARSASKSKPALRK